MTATIRIATRQSPLALWQAHHVGNQLIAHWPHLSYELVPMLTSGDRFSKDKLLTVGGKGLFVKELEEALLTHQADMAVHSMKDVPAFLPERLTLDVICAREAPWDVFVSKNYPSLDSLPQEAIVGTASLRRQSQLLAYRPDLQIQSLRGNIHTRIQKLDSQAFDAIILAQAGLQRLGMDDRIQEILSPDRMLPACGQGALGVECRKEDADTLNLISKLNDEATFRCVQTERLVNALLGGNCHVPVAVHCSLENDLLNLQSLVATPDGTTLIKDQRSGSLSQATSLAEQAVETLLSQGAKTILDFSNAS